MLANNFNRIYCIIFSLLLVVFVNSGFIKSFLKAANFIEFDVTIVSLTCLLPISVLPFVESSFNRDRLFIVTIFFMFIILYCTSALYTSSATYYITKLFAITGIVFSFLFGLISSYNIKQKFYDIYSIFTVVAVTIYFILIFSNLSVESLNDFTGNSLVAGEMLGAAILIFYFSNSRYKYFLILFSFSVLIALGARGPLIFSMLIIIFSILKNIQRSYLAKSFKLIPFLTMFLVLLFNINNELTETINKTFADGFSRFELLFQDNKGDSVNSRTIMLAKTLEHIENNPLLGTGIGSFGIEIYGQDFRAYPHNVPLEIWFESGLIPFTLFIIFVFALAYHLINKKDFLLLSLLLYSFANMNKSSSLEELRFFFLIAGLSIGSSKVKEYK